jgi:hypothetical protein
MTDTSTPWAAMVDEPVGLLPGQYAAWQREEAAIRADEQRKRSEAQDRADTRFQAEVWAARQYALHRGLPWDPQRPFEHRPTVQDRAAAMFDAMDREARAADFRAAQEAGLVHLLHQSAGQQQPVSQSPSSGTGPGAQGQATGTAARAATALGHRIRAALERWGSTSGTTTKGTSGDPAAGLPPVARSTFYEGTRTR